MPPQSARHCAVRLSTYAAIRPLPLHIVVVGGEEVSAAIQSGLRIHERDLRSAGDGARECEKRRGVQILQHSHDVELAMPFRCVQIA